MTRFRTSEAVALDVELGHRALGALAHENVRPDAAITTRCLIAWEEGVRITYRHALHKAWHMTGIDCPKCGDWHNDETDEEPF